MSIAKGSQLELFLTFYSDWLHHTGTWTEHLAQCGKPQTKQYTPWCTLDAFLDLQENPETYEVFFHCIYTCNWSQNVLETYGGKCGNR